MSDLTQKKCPVMIGEHLDPETGEVVKEICGKPAVKIARDRFGMRQCEDGHTWLPSKKRKADDDGSL